MKNRDGLENSNHWETPDWLLEELGKEFSFGFDPCPLHAGFDGLKIDWSSTWVNWVNPPYDRVNKPLFIQKTYDEWKKGKPCVLLVPSSTGTKQFHNLIAPVCKIRIMWDEYLADRDKYKDDNLIVFMKGRIAFKGYNTKGVYSEKNKGKHDSMIVIFRGKNK